MNKKDYWICVLSEMVGKSVCVGWNKQMCKALHYFVYLANALHSWKFSWKTFPSNRKQYIVFFHRNGLCVWFVPLRLFIRHLSCLLFHLLLFFLFLCLFSHQIRIIRFCHASIFCANWTLSIKEIVLKLFEYYLFLL